MIEQVLGMAIVVGIGLALGWHPHLAGAKSLELAGLLALGLFAFTWFGVLLGMLVRNSDAMQGVGFAIVLPLSFLAGTFVPIAGMKTVPRAIGEWDPLSSLVAAVRQICQGTPSSGSWQLMHPVPAMIGWCGLITAVCVPLALHRFRKMSTV
jgi:ABC-type multidrug transport system permease subunit